MLVHIVLCRFWAFILSEFRLSSHCIPSDKANTRCIIDYVIVPNIYDIRLFFSGDAGGRNEKYWNLVSDRRDIAYMSFQLR